MFEKVEGFEYLRSGMKNEWARELWVRSSIQTQEHFIYHWWRLRFGTKRRMHWFLFCVPTLFHNDRVLRYWRAARLYGRESFVLSAYILFDTFFDVLDNASKRAEKLLLLYSNDHARCHTRSNCHSTRDRVNILFCRKPFQRQILFERHVRSFLYIYKTYYFTLTYNVLT